MRLKLNLKFFNHPSASKHMPIEYQGKHLDLKDSRGEQIDSFWFFTLSFAEQKNYPI